MSKNEYGINPDTNETVDRPDHDAGTLAASLYTASELMGHNNKSLVEAVGLAQSLSGNTEDISENLKPFEINEANVEEANNYIDKLRKTSKVCLAQSKQLGEDVESYKSIDRLINSIGTAEDYSAMVFQYGSFKERTIGTWRGSY